MIASRSSDIQFLSRTSVASVVVNGADPAGCIAATLSATLSVHVELGSAINLENEIARLAKRISGVEKKIAPLRAAMTMADYEANVPESVRLSNAEKRAALEGEYESLNARKVTMASLLSP